MPQPIFKTFDLKAPKDICRDYNGNPMSIIFETYRSGTYCGDLFVLYRVKHVRPIKSEMVALELLPTANYNVVQVMKDFGFSDKAVFQWHDFKTLRIREEKCQ